MQGKEKQEVQRIQKWMESLEQIQDNIGSDDGYKSLAEGYLTEIMKVDDIKQMSPEDLNSQLAEAFADQYTYTKSLSDLVTKLDKVSSHSRPASAYSSNHKGIDFKQMKLTTDRIVKIQSQIRRYLAVKHLAQAVEKQRETLNKTRQDEYPEKSVLKEFCQQLSRRKLTPEAFYRMCDQEYSQKVSVVFFKQSLVQVGIQLSAAQLSRLIMILDEDLEGSITKEEFYSALEAYGLAGEKHFGENYVVFQNQVLFKLISELNRKSISFYQMFNACDVNDDASINIKELQKFIESLSPDFKIKELHSLISFLDIDRDHMINKDEFLRQMNRAEQQYLNSQAASKQNASQRAPAVQQDNFFQEEEVGEGDQSFFQDIGNAYNSVKSSFTSKKGQGSSKGAQQKKGNQVSDPKKSGIISKMEQEGQSIKSFFGGMKDKVVGGTVKLGQMMKSLQISHPTISVEDKLNLIKDSIVGDKVDMVHLEQTLQKNGAKNIGNSANQTFQVIATQIASKMGGEQKENIKMFFKAQSISESDQISEKDFLQLFSGKKFQTTLAQADLEAAFDSLNLQKDGFINASDLMEVLQSYTSKSKSKVSSINLKNVGQYIKGYEKMTPRTRVDEVIEFIIEELKKKNMKPINIYKLADFKNQGSVQVQNLTESFQKILPNISSDVFQEAMSAFNVKSQRDMIKRQDYESVFEESGSTDMKSSKSSFQANQASPQKVVSDSSDPLSIIRKLDNVFLRQGVSPQQAFRAADINNNGVITVDELKESLKKLLPDSSISLAEIKKIMMAFDVSRNGLIEEQEYIDVLENARNANVTMVDTPQKSRIITSENKKQLPVKGTFVSKDNGKGTNESEIVQMVDALNKKMKLKQFFGQIILNENGEILVNDLGRMFKNDPVGLKPSEYVEFLKFMDKEQKGYFLATDLIKFCEKNIKNNTSNSVLELKTIANHLEFIKNNKNTSQYLQTNAKLKNGVRLMEVEVLTSFQKLFQIPTSISKVIYKSIESNMDGKVMLDDIVLLIDQYRQIQIVKGKDGGSAGKVTPEGMLMQYFIKLSAMTKSHKAVIAEKMPQEIESQKGLSYNFFFNIFVEELSLLSTQESKVVFQLMISLSKVKGSVIPLNNFQQLKLQYADKFKVAQQQAFASITMKPQTKFGEKMAQVSMNQEGYISKKDLLLQMQNIGVIPKKAEDSQKTYFTQSLKQTLELDQAFIFPNECLADQYLLKALSDQSENAQFWVIFELLIDLQAQTDLCEEVLFKYLSKLLDILAPGKDTYQIFQKLFPDYLSMSSVQVLQGFIDEAESLVQQKVQGFDQHAMSDIVLDQMPTLWRKLGARAFKINGNDNLLLQGIDKHRDTSLVDKTKNQESSSKIQISKDIKVKKSTSSINMNDSYSEDNLVQQIESELEQPIETVLENSNDDVLFVELIPILSFQRIFTGENHQMDKKLLKMFCMELDTKKQGKILIRDLILYLKQIPQKYEAAKVVAKITDLIRSPKDTISKFLTTQGFNAQEQLTKEEFYTRLESISEVTKFESVCLFYEANGEDEDEYLETQKLFDYLESIKNPQKVGKTLPKEKAIDSSKIVKQEVQKQETIKQDVSKPEIQQQKSIRKGDRLRKTKSQLVDDDTENLKIKLKNEIATLQQILSKPKNVDKLLQLFDDGYGSITQYDFFTFLKESGLNTTEEQLDLLDDELNEEGGGELYPQVLQDFCDEFDIGFTIDVEKYEPKKYKEKMKANKKGEVMTVGDLTYTVGEEDYYRGVKTILNNEAAALCVAEKLYNATPEGKDFIDMDFGPKNDDDTDGNKFALYFNGEAPRGYMNPDNVSWVNPDEYVDDPVFMKDGTSSVDVKQGQLGDCWFIGALSVIAQRTNLLVGGLNSIKVGKDLKISNEMAKSLSEGVYPPIFHMYRKKGLWVFKFFKDFLWRYVIIDERIPVSRSNGRPVFATCKELNELWVPLIEKAYAKLHGCYQTLISGFVDDGLVDMTGYLSEKIKLHGKGGFPNPQLKDKEAFWKNLMELHNNGSMMGCSVAGDVERQIQVDGEPCGIMTGHAYGIIEMFEIPDPDMAKDRKTHRMLRLQNPWGKTEWQGKWSDQSEEVEDKYAEVLEADLKRQEKAGKVNVFKPGSDDGDFLINYQSWRDIYNNMFAAIDFPPEWQAVRYQCEWNEKCSGATPSPFNQETATRWAKNPQFMFAPKNDTWLFISLAQPDGRVKRPDGTYLKYPYAELIHPVCFAIVELREGETKVSSFQKSQNRYTSIMRESREVSGDIHLEGGKRYVIVCGTRNVGEYGPFHLSLYFDQKERNVNLYRIDDPSAEYSNIAEETETVGMQPKWKIKMIQERLKYMFTDSGNELDLDNLETDADGQISFGAAMNQAASRKNTQQLNSQKTMQKDNTKPSNLKQSTTSQENSSKKQVQFKEEEEDFE